MAESDFWTAKKEQAALLVATDHLTDSVIAMECQISRRTLTTWKNVPEFKERVSEILKAMREAILTQGIADRINRIESLDKRWNLMKTVIAERGTDPEMEIVPGGKTGLIVRQLKGVGKGDDFRLVEEFAVDTPLLKEMRGHEEQAAKELGQWTEKRELSGVNGGPIVLSSPEIERANEEYNEWRKQKQEEIANMLSAPPT